MLCHYVLYLRGIRFFLQGCGGVDGKYDVRITKDDVNMVPHGGEVGLCGLALWFSSVVMSREFLLACLGSSTCLSGELGLYFLGVGRGVGGYKCSRIPLSLFFAVDVKPVIFFIVFLSIIKHS